jgi:uncharacterized protein (DUF983 family)
MQQSGSNDGFCQIIARIWAVFFAPMWLSMLIWVPLSFAGQVFAVWAVAGGVICGAVLLYERFWGPLE